MLEGILDDVDVTDVHIHEVLLLFVIIGPLLESQAKKGDWVGELSSLNNWGISGDGSNASSLSLLHLGVISFLELVLEVLNLSFEVKLLSLMLGLKG